MESSGIHATSSHTRAAPPAPAPRPVTNFSSSLSSATKNRHGFASTTSCHTQRGRNKFEQRDERVLTAGRRQSQLWQPYNKGCGRRKRDNELTAVLVYSSQSEIDRNEAAGVGVYTGTCCCAVLYSISGMAWDRCRRIDHRRAGGWVWRWQGLG